jgi:hypothetical protein
MNPDKLLMAVIYAITMLYILWINYELTAELAIR